VSSVPLLHLQSEVKSFTAHVQLERNVSTSLTTKWIPNKPTHPHTRSTALKSAATSHHTQPHPSLHSQPHETSQSKDSPAPSILTRNNPFPHHASSPIIHVLSMQPSNKSIPTRRPSSFHLPTPPYSSNAPRLRLRTRPSRPRLALHTPSHQLSSPSSRKKKSASPLQARTHSPSRLETTVSPPSSPPAPARQVDSARAVFCQRALLHRYVHVRVAQCDVQPGACHARARHESAGPGRAVQGRAGDSGAQVRLGDVRRAGKQGRMEGAGGVGMLVLGCETLMRCLYQGRVCTHMQSH